MVVSVKIYIFFILSLLIALSLGCMARAGEVSVEDAKVIMNSEGKYRFSVTLRHADNGWDHYADRWQVLSPEGDVLATRTLLHPHDHEQPFTRGLSGVTIPDGFNWVTIRAHDKIHGNGSKLFRVELPGR